jgi:hypothetical protein
LGEVFSTIFETKGLMARRRISIRPPFHKPAAVWAVFRPRRRERRTTFCRRFTNELILNRARPLSPDYRRIVAEHFSVQALARAQLLARPGARRQSALRRDLLRTVFRSQVRFFWSVK